VKNGDLDLATVCEDANDSSPAASQEAGQVMKRMSLQGNARRNSGIRFLISCRRSRSIQKPSEISERSPKFRRKIGFLRTPHRSRQIPWQTQNQRDKMRPYGSMPLFTPVVQDIPLERRAVCICQLLRTHDLTKITAGGGAGRLPNVPVMLLAGYAFDNGTI
jgi:hypothetical protein